MNRDAIDDCLNDPRAFRSKPLDEVKAVIAWSHKRCPLEYSIDDPLPQWADNVLSLDRVPTKVKYKILRLHNSRIITYRSVKESRSSSRAKTTVEKMKKMCDEKGISLDTIRGLFF